jgi:pimeloyl-ACP methyl ester carboxylesterase
MPIAAVNGTELYYEVQGQGEPVVLIPGLGMGTAYFDLAMPHLTPHVQAIGLDLRGVGRSSKADTAFSMETWADDVVRLLDHLGVERAHVVGASLGGCIALAMADRHRDRLASIEMVAAFTELDYALELNWRLRTKIVEATGMSEPIGEHVTLWTLGRRFLETEHGQRVAAGIRSGIGANDPKLYLGFLKAILDFGRVTPETQGLPRYTELLPELEVPTIWIVGDEDILTPPLHSERGVAAMPDGYATLAVIPECGHVTMIEKPEENARLVVDFVQRVASGSAVPA